MLLLMSDPDNDTTVNKRFIEYCKRRGLRVVDDKVALADIERLLDLKNLRQSSHTNGGTFYKFETPTRGVQQLKFVDASIVRVIVSKRRYTSDPELYESLGMVNGRCTTYHPSDEAEFVEFIESAFDGYRMVRQHAVGQFSIDLFFPDYNLAVEIDEAGHRFHVDADLARQQAIEAQTGCAFIRCKTYESGALPRCCNAILKHISCPRPATML